MLSSASTVRANVMSLRSVSPDASDSDTNKVVKTILNSRKSWRNMKGKEEAVWPPELEAILIEGLEKYRPAEVKSNRILYRFPMRNRFVADYIFETTGKRRTPKQVGSRIQQLRDTNSGKHFVKSISDQHFEMMYPKISTFHWQAAGPSRLITRTLEQPTTLLPTSPSIVTPTHVYINILPPNSTMYPRSSYPTRISSISAQNPRPLHVIDPTVSFTSPGQTPCQAIFQIYKAGQFMQEEYTSVSISSASLSEPGTSVPLFTYSTALVPQYWSFLCEVEDLSPYIIYLQVMRMPLSTGCPSGSSLLFSALYHFVDASAHTLPSRLPSLSPRCSFPEAALDFSTLSSGLSPSPLFNSVTNHAPPTLRRSGGALRMSLLEPVFDLEDECQSLPDTPLDFPTADGQLRGYSQSRISPLPPSPSPSPSPSTMSLLALSACDSYLPLEATAIFDAFV